MMSHSGAARGGVDVLTKTLALEWAPRGIRVNSVAPGIIYSDSGMANYGDLADQLIGTIKPTIPAGRLGSVEEVSAATVFLLTDAASYITGAIIPVDGGSQHTLMPLIPTQQTKTNFAVYGTLPPQAKL